MDSLFENRHAQVLPKTPLEHTAGLARYLPHYPVVNPNEPDNVRVVYDCAARYNGVPLSSQLLQDPDLTNNLVGALIRFGKEPIAIMAYIKGMFHRVRVSPQDCDALRFLWWPENDLNKDPEDYQMLVHLFGATLSPSFANFGLKQTADNNDRLKFTCTTQGMPLKEVIFGKKLRWKFSNALFQELERCYGIRFPQTREMYLNQSLRKQSADFSLRLSQIETTMLK